jgi:hypothetical protein
MTSLATAALSRTRGPSPGSASLVKLSGSDHIEAMIWWGKPCAHDFMGLGTIYKEHLGTEGPRIRVGIQQGANKTVIPSASGNMYISAGASARMLAQHGVLPDWPAMVALFLLRDCMQPQCSVSISRSGPASGNSCTVVATLWEVYGRQEPALAPHSRRICAAPQGRKPGCQPQRLYSFRYTESRKLPSGQIL